MTKWGFALAAAAYASALFACGGHTKLGPSGDGSDGGTRADASVIDTADGGGSDADTGVTARTDADTGVPATIDASGDGAEAGVTWTVDAGVSSCISSVPLRPQFVDKLDLLFMIDNSASMGDKQALLALAVPDLITRLVTPNCVDGSGHVLARSDMNGQCASGKLEFSAVHDMHIGIVTSSLGGRGGNQCDATVLNEANMTLNAHDDDRGELINRGGDTEAPVPNAGSPLNFLAWFPSVAANSGATPPVPPETTVGATGQAGTLIGDFTAMISGVHEHGCGFEAQNEAWYRFLIQPDPFDTIAITNNRATLSGIDSLILQQRKAFLRPDSLLAVIVVTDENEEVANPMSIGGEGWLFESAPFPSSPTFGAPEGTIECKAAPGPMSGPNDPNCTSCAFQNVQSAANFSTRCPNDPPNGSTGFLDPTNDNVNVRFFNQKARFGVFAGYPVSRYIRGLTSATVPDRANEVDGNGNYVGDQDVYANCVNPIFAQNLPTDPGADLCHLARGPRTPDLVYYAAIAGVPHQLLQAHVGDPECPAGTLQADCPQKERLAEADWQAITGRDPEHYDFTGVDFHMLESIDARGGSACSPTASDNCDPINGREWSTNKQDLQFACIFPLAAPKDCTDPQFAGACDCAVGSNSHNTPLCQMNGGLYTTTQINGKAYPSVREMAIAHAMSTQASGVQGVVSSLCPIHPTATNAIDPVFGYRPAASAIVSRLKNGLGVQCLPPNICLNSAGAQQCVVWVTLPNPGGEDQCSGLPGLSIPPANLLQPFQQSQHQGWVAAGGPSTGLPDPSTLPTCLLQQLTPQQNPAAFGLDDTCAASMTPGWCSVGGPGGSCTQQLVFAPSEPPAGATVSLQCFP
jgi:hypothetical protein